MAGCVDGGFVGGSGCAAAAGLTCFGEGFLRRSVSIPVEDLRCGGAILWRGGIWGRVCRGRGEVHGGGGWGRFGALLLRGMGAECGAFIGRGLGVGSIGIVVGVFGGDRGGWVA